MGFIDKLKNIFFEEEEDEEIEETLPPKKEKQIKLENKEISEEKKLEKEEVIAKKVEIPTEEKKDKIVQKEIVKPKETKINKINTELIFDDDDFIFDTPPKVEKKEAPIVKKNVSLYRVKENKEEKVESKKYDIPKSTYVGKQNQNVKNWTPSPIISPIYGILDKNYKKEEVKENKEIRISSRPSRMDVDSIRNKAFGDLEYDLFENIKEDREEIDDKQERISHYEQNKEEIRRSYKSSDDKKPTIDRVTLGEADEYYNDLGLAYNTDYKDLSKDINDGKISEEKTEKKKIKKEKLEDNLFDLIESMYDREE